MHVTIIITLLLCEIKKKILNCEWTDFRILENPEIFHGLRWTLSALIVQRW